MRRLLAMLLFVVCFAPPALADEPESMAYAPHVAACLAGAGDDAALAACEGAASRPCIEADGGTTHGMVMCFSAEAEAWTRQLTDVVARLNEAEPHGMAALSAAQESWRAYAEAECSYRVTRWGDGSGARVELASCFASLTAQRALTLLRYERAR